MSSGLHKKIYGLIGYPVKHSLSPRMHNAALRALKINAEYKLFPLKENKIRSFLKDLENKNIFGLNVTVPHKEKVIPFLDKLSKEVRLIGAVNTIKRVGDKLLGFNTDGEGFVRHLTRDLKFNPKGKAIAVVGAGGAAKAVSVYLSKSAPKKISIYDTDKPKAKNLINHLKKNFKNNTEFFYLDTLKDLDTKNIDLLINATPLGLKRSDPLPIKPEFLHKGLLVYDLIYNPKETRLLKLAKKSGTKISNGLGMLLYQGARSFEIWTGRIAPINIMRKSIMEAI